MIFLNEARRTVGKARTWPCRTWPGASWLISYNRFLYTMTRNCRESAAMNPNYSFLDREVVKRERWDATAVLFHRILLLLWMALGQITPHSTDHHHFALFATSKYSEVQVPVALNTVAVTLGVDSITLHSIYVADLVESPQPFSCEGQLCTGAHPYGNRSQRCRF